MEVSAVQNLIWSVRNQLDFDRGTQPIIDAVYEHQDGSLHLVVPDRAEKSQCIGPGGRIVAELRKQLSQKITIYSHEELLVMNHRLHIAMKRLDELRPSVSNNQSLFMAVLEKLLEQHSAFPECEIDYTKIQPSACLVSVAYSGGIDSSASLLVLNEIGLFPLVYTAGLGKYFLKSGHECQVKQFCQNLGFEHHTIDIEHRVSETVSKANEGLIHPCGECHKIIIDSIKSEIDTTDSDILVTGELLPTGRQSVILEDGLMIVHLPGLLSMSKFQTSELVHRTNSLLDSNFGCLLLSEVHSKGWRSIGPSIFRVLRELEAGVLTTGQALNYIKYITKPTLYIAKQGGKE